MNWIAAFIFVLLIAGEGLFFSRILRFPAHVGPLVAILLDTLILYVFGVNNSLAAGYRFVLILATLLSVAGFFYPKNIKLNTLLPIPIAAFILISVGIYFYTRGTVFYDYDEYAHWGLVYRYLMTMQSIPVSLSNVTVTYPPFSGLWQYFTSSFLGSFDEANAYLGHMMVLYAAILALFPVRSWKSWGKFLPALIAAVFSVFVMGYTFQSLYVDLYLGLLFAAGLAQIDLKGDYPASSSVTVGLIAGALTLVKSTGFLLALILITIYAICLIYSRVAKKASLLQYAGSFLAVFLIVIIPILCWNSWGKFSQPLVLDRLTFEWMGTPTSFEESFPPDIAAYQQSQQNHENDIFFLKKVLLQPVDETITLQGVFESFSIHAPYRTKTIAAKFVDTFSNTPMGEGKVTQKWVLVGTILLGVINQVLLRKQSKLARNQNGIQNLLLLVGFALYAAAIYLAYIYLFLPNEALTVPSFTRYLGSFTLAWWLANLAVLFRIADLPKPESESHIAFWVMIVFSLACLLYLPTSKYIHIPYQPIDARFDAEARYQKLSRAGLQTTDKVYDLWPRDPQGFRYRHTVMRYLLTPVGSNVEQSYLAHYDSNDGSYIQDLSPDQWMALLHYQNYTYVMVTYSDENFWKTYGSLFDYQPQDWGQTYLYKVGATGLQFVPLQ
jgi:hypothetical protein